MKYIFALVAFCATLAWATAAPRPVYNPYGLPEVYGGGYASAYAMIDATSDLYNNNMIGRSPYGSYNPRYGPLW